MHEIAFFFALARLYEIHVAALVVGGEKIINYNTLKSEIT